MKNPGQRANEIINDAADRLLLCPFCWLENAERHRHATKRAKTHQYKTSHTQNPARIGVDAER